MAELQQIPSITLTGEPLAGGALRQNLLELDREGLERFFAETLGEQRYRAHHKVMKWIHHRYVTDFDQMTDLGKALRAKLHAHAEVVVPNVVFDKPSADGTHKWLLAMGADGKNAIEAVYIPDKGRGTLCVSSQVGCGLNCTFCSTATQGFNRNLTTAEIIGQGLGRRPPPGQRAAPAAPPHQCGDDGHGRAADEFRQRRARDERDARRPGLRPYQQARDPVDVRP